MAVFDLPRRQFTHGGVRVRLMERPELMRSEDGELSGIKVRIRAWKDGQELPTDDGVHIAVNPPIKVPDGTWRVENTEGAEQDIKNLQESPATSLRDWLVESVASAARREGWFD